MAPLLAFIVTGCIGGNGEDHWTHYEGGGMFVTDSPSMSPDGSTVVFSSPCSGRGDVVRVNRDGTGRVKLTGTDDYEASPIYSPDGAKIAYVREHAGDRHIWIMNADGTGQKPLTSGRVMDDLVGFSADGSRILFLRSLPTGGLGKFAEPYVMRTDGKELGPRVEKPEGVVKDGGVASPDGKRIFSVTPPYARDLCVRNVDGARERVIAAPKGYKTLPRLSPDGTTLLSFLYSKGDKRVPDVVVLVDVSRMEVVGLLSVDCERERAPDARVGDRP